MPPCAAHFGCGAFGFVKHVRRDKKKTWWRFLLTFFVNIFRGPTFWQFWEKKRQKKQLLFGRSMGITVKHDFLVKKKTTTITFRVIPQRGWVRVQQVAFFVFSPCHFWPFYFFFQLCCSKFARTRARTRSFAPKMAIFGDLFTPRIHRFYGHFLGVQLSNLGPCM